LRSVGRFDLNQRLINNKEERVNDTVLVDFTAGAGPHVGAFSQEYRYVRRVLSRHGVCSADVEDLVQEVFLVMWRRRDHYQRNRSLLHWLAGIAIRVAMKHLERRQRELPSTDAEPTDAAPLPDDYLASARARSLALAAIDRLPDRHRTALVWHALDGVSVRDLAARWAVPLPTAYTRVRVAREALANVISELQRTGSGRHR
jgi:RNA polymerase sigma factor (sigma-70 family)